MKYAVARKWGISSFFALLVVVTFGGCPRLKTGYLINITADINRQQPYEMIRNAVLSTGDFEGPIKVESGGGLCEEAKYYRKLLPKSRVEVIFHDCYRASQFSETGWAYLATLSGRQETLQAEVRREMEMVAEEIKTVIQQTVPTVKVTVRAMETGYGFSLLPY